MYQDYAALRDERHITDYQVAKETGINQSTLTAWKNGEYTPKVDKLAKIAKLFHVPLEQLIEEVE
jgi:transcriptional regulator with XRE-family HTH domain